MKNFLAYPWALVYGLYFYGLFQLVFLVRFGSVNLSTNVLDVMLIIIGIISATALLFFMRKLERRRGLMLIPFILAVPFSFVGALGGGLIGVVALLLFSLVPFVITLPIGYWLIKRFARQ